jgi:hypothetical protein
METSLGRSFSAAIPEEVNVFIKIGVTQFCEKGLISIHINFPDLPSLAFLGRQTFKSARMIRWVANLLPHTDAELSLKTGMAGRRFASVIDSARLFASRAVSPKTQPLRVEEPL